MKKDDAFRAREDAFKKSVGERLLAARLALGKKRSEWTGRYKIIASRYSQWESGISLPDLLLLTTICQDEGISLDYILRGVQDDEQLTIRIKAKTSPAVAPASTMPEYRLP